MAMILRFVNDEGKVMERFLGLNHIEKCTSVALKEALVCMISSHKLSISKLRGQSYDGASNMRREFKDNLSRALQRKDQDKVEAMHLINGVKERLQDTRDNGWEPLFKRVKSFCDKNEIKVPNMDEEVNARGTYARRRQKVAPSEEEE
ncbi:uncharacterized protein LOC112891644 [Panicum hallii]|uniref:uncharacterized protein LOC112891644 n=1 Tax=Panicum hallii TaxID=206008 RepID=UPI000DF4D1DA|nr:uncharacterized protein LOC112891644 [Panicum hallii]